MILSLESLVFYCTDSAAIDYRVENETFSRDQPPRAESPVLAARESQHSRRLIGHKPFLIDVSHFD